MNGSCRRLRAARLAARRTFAAFLIYILVAFQTPAAAWAQAGVGEEPGAEQVAAGADQSQSDQGQGDQGSGDPSGDAGGAEDGGAPGGGQASGADGAGSDAGGSAPEESGSQAGAPGGSGKAPSDDGGAGSDAGETDQPDEAAGPAPSNGASATPAADSALLGEADQDDAVTATASIVGRDADGEVETWAAPATYELPAASTAADLTEAMLDRCGIAADFGMGDYGWYLNTITSPADPGRVLGWDEATGRYWRLFVNGVPSEVGAGSVELAAGDEVVWYYSAYGEGLPGAGGGSEDGEPEQPGDGDEGSGDEGGDAEADLPDWEASWPGYGSGGAAVDAPTSTAAAEDAWVVQMKDPADWSTYVSDPVIVNGRVYAVVGGEVVVLDSKTGEELGRGQLAAKMDSVSRMTYADGLLLVPLAGGRLQALAADTLATVWVTDELPAGDGGAQQALSSVAVRDGVAYFGTVSAGWSSSYGGYLLAVDLSTGETLWRSESAAGYYWGGAATVGGYVVVADDGGTLEVLDAGSGSRVDAVQLPAGSRSGVVPDGEGGVVAVTKDGVLYRYALSATGDLALAGSVKFGSSASGTPTIVSGKAYVGGSSVQGYENEWGYQSYYGQLAVIDLASMTVEQSVTSADGEGFKGAVQSSPLVSAQGGRTYVYFTVNAQPGGVMCYRVGDAEATAVYTPDAEHANYCMSSVACDENGVMYYVNDSGAMFAIAAGFHEAVGPGQGGTGTGQGGDDAEQGGSGTGQGGHAGSHGSAGGAQGGNAGSDGSASDAVGRGLGRALGTVAPSMRPVSASAAGGAVSPALAPEPSGGEGSADSAAAGADTQARGADAVALAQEVATAASRFTVLPVAGIVVGTLGLVGVVVWWARSRREQ